MNMLRMSWTFNTAQELRSMSKYVALENMLLMVVTLLAEMDVRPAPKTQGHASEIEMMIAWWEYTPEEDATFVLLTVPV